MANNSCTYLPGWSEVRAATQRFINVEARNTFFKIRTGTIARLGRKLFGEQQGLCPVEEVFSLSSVDPGVIVPLGCEDRQLNDEDVQKGIDCLGNEIDIETKGGQADSFLCRSYHRGSFAVGVDAFKPEFYSYERRFPTICVDAAMASAKEVKATLQAIQNKGPEMVVTDLDYLMWDLVVARGTGNTSISHDVVFGADVGLTNGQFPFRPQSYLNHEFMKAIQQIAMADPDNRGKRFIVEASELQIKKAIEDDQRQKGIERRVMMNEIPDPFRAEPTLTYDGITYIAKDMPDYVGVIDYNTYCTFIRPRHHVHQAGTEHGVVARPNYDTVRGCRIECNGYTLDKFEVAHWYLEDAVMFVPFMARGNVPTNGKEEIKDHVYATPTAFKSFNVKDHAVELRANCVNDRGQYQQMGMMVKFGLFHRPDKINFGAVLMAPVNRCIELQTDCCPEDSCPPPDTKEIRKADDETVSGQDCPPCEGSSDTTGGGLALAEVPTPANPDPGLASADPGEFALVGINHTVVEGVHPEVQICVERLDGVQGAAQIDVTLADDTAADGTNYTDAGPYALNWAAGESGRKCITVAILVEPTATAKSFTATIAPDGAEVIQGGDTATVTINPTPPCDPGDCPCGPAPSPEPEPEEEPEIL